MTKIKLNLEEIVDNSIRIELLDQYESLLIEKDEKIEELNIEIINFTNEIKKIEADNISLLKDFKELKEESENIEEEFENFIEYNSFLEKKKIELEKKNVFLSDENAKLNKIFIETISNILTQNTLAINLAKEENKKLNNINNNFKTLINKLSRYKFRCIELEDVINKLKNNFFNKFSYEKLDNVENESIKSIKWYDNDGDCKMNEDEVNLSSRAFKEVKPIFKIKVKVNKISENWKNYNLKEIVEVMEI